MLETEVLARVGVQVGNRIARNCEQGPTVLDLTFLGSFAVRRDDVSITRFRSDKVRALLAYLAVEAGRPHPRSKLAALLWPDQSDELALSNLSQTLSRLRDTLGDASAEPPFLLISRQYVQWNASAATTIDVADFIRLAHSSDSADLQAAAALYGGTLLPGLFVPACEEFAEWLTVAREQLERTALQVFDALAQAYLARGSYAAAEAAARRQLALDPWREAAHRQAMEALAGTGQRSAALAQYASCKRILDAELGVEPEVTTTALYEQIRAGELGQPVELPALAQLPSREERTPARIVLASHQHDWHEAPDLGPFYGREHEQGTVLRWLFEDGCRVIALVGLGGVGKTALAANIMQREAGRFDSVIWRSLLNAPPLAELLRGMLGTLSEHQANVTAGVSEQLDLLLEYLRRRRCLVVFDNLESILQGGASIPAHRAGYAEYGELLQRLGHTRHRSCVLLTSREEPPELARLRGDADARPSAVRVLTVGGLPYAAATSILEHHGLAGADAAPLVQAYGGHPLALKLVADTIRDFYAGDIAEFLQEDAPIFADIRAVLDEQFAQLTRLEQEMLVWLALSREPRSVAALQSTLLGKPSRAEVLEAVHSLRRRSLLELHGDGLTLQNVVLEYATDRLIAQVYRELSDGQCDWLNRFALLQPGAKEYVRRSQARLIVQPIAQRLAHTFGENGVRERFAQLLDKLRHLPRAPGYMAGNLVNLLLGLGVPLRGLDFGQLCVWQADLRNAEAQEVSFAGADLAGTRFTDSFASITSVQVTPDGERLLAACADGTLRLWRVRDGRPLGVFAGHTGVVWSVAVSPDGRLCASGGDDCTVRVWNVEDRQTVSVLHGHTHSVRAVAWSPDGSTLASGGQDHNVNVWELPSGRHVATLRGHLGAVYAVAFAPDRSAHRLLASAGADLQIHLWNVSTGHLLRTLAGCEGRICCLAWSPDGAGLLSSGHEHAPRMWDTTSWQQRGALIGHSGIVPTVAYSADGATIVSGSFDGTVRIWDAATRQPKLVMHGHTGWIHGVACSPDGVTAASGGADQTARIWDMHSGHELHTLAGHTTWTPALDLTPDGYTLVSGHWDTTLRVWDMRRGTTQYTLRGHTNHVTGVACSPDGTCAASGSVDSSVCLWNLQTGQLVLRLQGHTAAITDVAFHPLGRIVASSSLDGTVRVWDAKSGHSVQTLSGHTERVTAVAFSPDGSLLATGSPDRSLRLWSTDRWIPIRVLEASAPGSQIWSLAFNNSGAVLAAGHYEGTIDIWDVRSGERRGRMAQHSNIVQTLAFTPDDARLVSCSDDTTIRVWDVATGEQQHVLDGHAIRTIALAVRPPADDPAAPPIIASSGCDEIIKLWDIHSARCVQTLRAAGPFAGMNITGAIGLNATQRQALIALGAVEELVVQKA